MADPITRRVRRLLKSCPPAAKAYADAQRTGDPDLYRLAADLYREHLLANR